MAFLEYQTNLRGWWEADDLSPAGIRAGVESWVSRINPSYVLSAAGGAGLEPDMVDDGTGPNGHAYLNFDGVQDYLEGGVTWNNLVTASLGTLIVVAKPDAVDTNSGTVVNNDALIHGNTANCPGMFLRNNAGVYTYYAHQYDGTAVDVPVPIPAAEALGWAIYMWRLNSTSGQIRGNRNNAYPVISAACGAISSLAIPIRVGRNGGGGAYFDGGLAAILAYREEVTSANLSKVLSYLEAKYFSPRDATIVSPLIRGDGNEQIRDAQSRRLLEREQRESIVEWTGGLALLDYEIGDALALVHSFGPDPLGAGGGWPETAPKTHVVIGLRRDSATAVTLTLRPI